MCNRSKTKGCIIVAAAAAAAAAAVVWCQHLVDQKAVSIEPSINNNTSSRNLQRACRNFGLSALFWCMQINTTITAA